MGRSPIGRGACLAVAGAAALVAACQRDGLDALPPLAEMGGSPPRDLGGAVDLTGGLADLRDPARAAWPMFLHDAQRRSCAAGTGPSRGVQKWSVAQPAGKAWVWPPVIAADGALVLAAGEVWAAADGSVRSRFSPAGCGGYAFAGDGTLFTHSCEGQPQVCALDLGRGAARWCVPSSSDPDVPLLLTGDGTVVVANAASIDALAPEDGHSRWTALMPGPVQGLAEGDNGDVIVETVDRVAAVVGASGEPRWLVARGFLSPGPVIGRDGSIYVFESADYERLVALDAGDGHERWRYSTAFVSITGAPAVARDGALRLVVGQDLVSVGLDGKERWRSRLPGAFPDHAVVDGAGTTYVLTNGQVHAVGADGVLGWSAQGDFWPPQGGVLGPEGLLYVMGTSPSWHLVALGD